jgi:Tfp pilus assembly protein PilF
MSGNEDADPAVNDTPPWTSKADRIAQLDRAIAQSPAVIESRYERASLLREQGSFEAAKRDYLDLLRHQPSHFGALNDFGTLLLKAGFKDAARTVYSEAVAHHPNNPMGRVNLANLLYLLDERTQARLHFEAALQIDPDHIHAHRGMANILAEIGDEDAARRHRDKGFKNSSLTTLPYLGDRAPVSVLLLVSALGGNIPTGPILDDRYFQSTVLVTEYFDPNAALPPHDFVFNTIGDADLCREGLQAACSIVARSSRPVVNHPAAVLKTGRLSNAERLRGIPGVQTPRMVRRPRAQLAGPDAFAAVESLGFEFPLLLRAPGFHTGRHFIRVENPNDLAAAVAALPGPDVWAMEFLDARDRDGKFRKIRAMMIDGKIYPLHLAISGDWKVHYFRAEMADSAEHRLQDAAFLEDMPGVVGARGMAALEKICSALSLDYGGIDFAVSAEGDILLFEANATMVMIPLSADPKWDYRRPAFDRVFAAIRTMLIEKSGSNVQQPDEPAAAAAS